MVTTEHTKVKTTGESLRNFISYFQSVTTIGIINRARSAGEAESKARRKLDNSDFMCGVVGQTPFELHATDEWQPSVRSDCDAETSIMDESIDVDEPIKLGSDPIILNLDEKTKRCLADKFCKDFASLTNSDYAGLLKTLIEMGLE